MRSDYSRVDLEDLRHLRFKVFLPQKFSDLDERETCVEQILAHILRSGLEEETLVMGLSLKLSELEERPQRLIARAAIVFRAMTDDEVRTVDEPDFTASIRKSSQTLDVVAEIWRPQPPKLDHQGLLAH
jgi:hypothetical protein